MKISVINSGNFKLDGGAMHGVVPKSLWNKFNAADENNLCSWAMRCLLIENNGRLILIDTGIGDKQDAKFFGHYHLHGDDSLLGNIKKAGYSPDEITDVFLTHLHFDHVGGAVSKNGDNLIPTFKNAKYWTNHDHWQWAIEPNAREKASFLKENLLPLQESGQLHFLNKDSHDMPFDIKYVFGHTEAMMLPLIEYNGQKILYCADLIPSLAHIPLPWIMGYDMRPLETLNEKTQILNEAAENNYLLFFEHDYQHELCSLKNTEKGIIFDEIIKTKDL